MDPNDLEYDKIINDYLEDSDWGLNSSVRESRVSSTPRSARGQRDKEMEKTYL